MKFKDFTNETSAGVKMAISGDDVNANLKRMEAIFATCKERIKRSNDSNEMMLDSLKQYQKDIEKVCGDNRKRKKARDIVDELTKITYDIKRLVK